MALLAVLPPALFAALLLAPFIELYFEAKVNAGCDQLEEFATMPSPDGRWVAVVHENVCSDGAFTTVIIDTVQLASRSAPERQADVIGLDEGGHPEERPVLAWTGPSTLRVTVPNYSYLGRYVREFDGVKVDLRFEHDDPASRAASLKRLGLPPDP